MDIWGCDQPSDASLANGNSFCWAAPAAENPNGHEADLRLRNASVSYTIGLVLLSFGSVLVWSGLWLPSRKTIQITPILGIIRWLIVYCLGASAVCLWRGIWYWADSWILPNDPIASYWVTSAVGAGTAFLVCCGNSLLAPPAIFLLDGPDTDPPPIAVTVLGSHYAVTLAADEKQPHHPLIVHCLDILLSFGFLPFAVVWFWRGSWLVLDYYLWGFTASDRDVHISIVWSMILFLVCIWLTSEPIVGLVDKQLGHIKLAILGRLRTYVLAWGTVALWRCFWLFWDEFLGGTTGLSAGLGHVLSLVLLTAMGCVSCINAPASTLGVDSIPNPKCADSPLFSMVPLPWETLYAFGMFRQADKEKVAEAILESSELELTPSTPPPIPAPRPAVAATAEPTSTGSATEGQAIQEETPPQSLVPQQPSREPIVRDDTELDHSSQRAASTGFDLEDQFDDFAVGLDPRIHSEGNLAHAGRLSAMARWEQMGGSVNRLSALSSRLDHKPAFRAEVCTEYPQRPNLANARSRSRLFKSR